jgi:CRP-like cAMP-binding protein
MTIAKNHMLELLPRRDRSRLLSHFERVDFSISEVLCEPGAIARQVYFPIGGFISLVTSIDGKPVLEVGMVGSEGMLGAHLATGVSKWPLHAVVQGPGDSWRVSAAEFREDLEASAALRKLVNRYLYVLMTQFATAAGCLRFHTITRRLARWLLMTQDRANQDSFHVTHEFLSYMLGVRREGITASAGELHAGGLIHYHRGEVVVLDRPGLERAACSCYEVDRQSYAEQLK